MLEKYLKYRFLSNNTNKYKQYCNEWINSLLPEQLLYFEREMYNLIGNGKYDPSR